MTDILSPATPEQVRDAVAWAVDSRTPLRIQGHGSRDGLGRPVTAPATLDLSRLSGILDYQPAELMLTAHAGTPLAEITAALAERGQHLAFEPPDLAPLYGGAAGAGTVGGLVACNAAGPRRIAAGAVRDHFLGCQAVGGRAELFKAGGKVVKNVTGFDLCKLLAGSFGTLAVLTEVTLKVLPAPEQAATVAVRGLDDAAADRCLAAALQSSHEVVGAAHVPAALSAAVVAGAGEAVTLVRVEGPGPSVEWRAAALCRELGTFGPAATLAPEVAAAAWAAVRDGAAFREEAAEALLWRISVAPLAGPQVVAAVQAHGAVRAVYDWGGGLVWLTLSGPAPAEQAQVLRAAVAAGGGGHATLLRAPAEVRATVPVFEPQPAPLAALTRRMKETFDPAGVLNPGRMAEGA
ncbi:glycolate oxidase subunit GlcE [Caenispirillum bisanense]|uniref:glycolate oxidase subunit GlcE n=1 Tax=Caenispirillum bisanense TaxID=414052 RepID=UPI0031D3B2EB